MVRIDSIKLLFKFESYDFLKQKVIDNEEYIKYFSTTPTRGSLIQKTILDMLYQLNDLEWVSNQSKRDDKLPNTFSISQIIKEGINEQIHYRFDNEGNRVYTNRFEGKEMIIKILYHTYQKTNR